MNTVQVRIDGKFYPGTLPQELALFLIWCMDHKENLNKDPWGATKRYLESRPSWTSPNDISKGGSAEPIKMQDKEGL